MKILSACTIAYLAVQAAGAAISHKLKGFTITEHPDPLRRAELQDIVCLNSAGCCRHLLRRTDPARLPGMSTLYSCEGRGL